MWNGFFPCMNQRGFLLENKVLLLTLLKGQFWNGFTFPAETRFQFHDTDTRWMAARSEQERYDTSIKNDRIEPKEMIQDVRLDLRKESDEALKSLRIDDHWCGEEFSWNDANNDDKEKNLRQNCWELWWLNNLYLPEFDMKNWSKVKKWKKNFQLKSHYCHQWWNSIQSI